jgi:hypothetical protein
MPEDLIQLGAVAVLFLIAIREFFAYLKTRKNGDGGNGNALSGAILNELRTMNSNHLHSLQKAIEDGNSRLVDVIHADNTKMIELLGEIKGSIRK